MIISQFTEDRIFWIYFILSLFFTIIISNNLYKINIPVLLLLIISNICLLFIIYLINTKYPYQSGYKQLWFLYNILFLFLLIMSTLWSTELSNDDNSYFGGMAGILLILGGIILISITLSPTYLNVNYINCIISFWLSIIFILIWLGLTFYIIMK